MLQIARLAPSLLEDSADLVQRFVLSKLNPDGGFQDREGKSDLYYNVFGMACLTALKQSIPLEKIIPFHQSFNTGDDLDFIHLTSLIRCHAYTKKLWNDSTIVQEIVSRLESYRSKDGGYNVARNASFGSAYGCFMAVGAYQDLQLEIPNPDGIAQCLHTLQTQDGGYANISGMPEGTTPTTAAAVTVLHVLGYEVPAAASQWLLDRCHEEGGFFAVPNAPLPDLLSTATALHALERMKIPTDSIKEPCLDYIDSLWCNEGGFYGHWLDDMIDCEYTYYGLLALGHLSL